MSQSARRFGLVVRLGVAANFGLAGLALFTPDLLLSLLGLELARPDVWLRFAAWLLILLSLFYLQPAAAPLHSPLTSRLVVGARFAGVVFFVSIYLLVESVPTYLLFAGFDAAFGIPQAYLLHRVLAEAG